MTTRVTKISAPEETKGQKFLRIARLADFTVTVNCLIAELDPAEALPQNYPLWVRRCGRRVTRALFPRVYRAFEGKSPSRAYDLGLAFGMMESGQKMLTELSDQIGPLPQTEITDANSEGLWHLLYGDGAKTLTFTPGDDLIPVEIRRELSERQQRFTLQQQADFHQGVADVTRMMNGENESTATTDIYTFMLIFWRVIDRLPTFEAFYDIATKVFGQNRTGNDPKRLAQMCQRVGKKFRRPGRPPKTTSTQLMP